MARITHFDQGDVWVPQATFTIAGTPTDPTNITVRKKAPDGTVTVLGPESGGTGGSGIVRVSAGVFNTLVPLNDAGYWYVRFEGMGTAEAAEDHEAVVDPSPFYESGQIGDRALVSLAEAKDWLQGQQVDTGEDLELARVINDISDRFHKVARREFKVVGENPQERTIIVTELPARAPWYIDGDYQGDLSPYSRWVGVGDMSDVDTVELLDNDWVTVLETVSAGNMTLHREDELPDSPITDIEFHSNVTALWPGMRVKITGAWGFPAVPGNVRQAVLDAVTETMDRDVEHWRQDLAPASGGEAGNVIVIGRTGSRPVSLPPRALAVARDYRNRVPLG